MTDQLNFQSQAAVAIVRGRKVEDKVELNQKVTSSIQQYRTAKPSGDQNEVNEEK